MGLDVGRVAVGLREKERTADEVEGIDGRRCSHAISDGPYAGRSAVHSWSCHRCGNAVSQPYFRLLLCLPQFLRDREGTLDMIIEFLGQDPKLKRSPEVSNFLPSPWGVIVA